MVSKIDEDKADTSTSNFLDEDVISSDTNEKGINNNLNNRTKQELTVNISSNKNNILSDYYIDDGKSNILEKQNNSTKSYKQDIVGPDTLDGSNTQNTVIYHKHHDKKDAVFDNEKDENKIRPLVQTYFTTISSEQSLPPSTSLQIEENDTHTNRFISKKVNEKNGENSIKSNTIQRSYNNESEETYDKIQLPYNKDLSKTGDTKNIIITSNNLFDEENQDDLNNRNNLKDSSINEDSDSLKIIKNHNITSGTSKNEKGFDSNSIIQTNFGKEQYVQKKDIPETVVINKALIMSTVNVSAMKVKPNGKYVETDIASKTHAIQVNFRLSKNSFNKAGNKNVYIVIQNPKGKVINEKGTFVLKNGQELSYTDQTVTYYHKTNLDVTIMSDRFIQKIVKGNYIVKIYIEGELIGMTLLILGPHY